MFAALHTRSVWSGGLGTATARELAARMARLSLEAGALTDVENLHGAVEFAAAAKKVGVRALHGIELRAGHGATTPGNLLRRLVLLAKDGDGWSSLCRIVARRRAQAREPTDDPLRCLSTSPRGLWYASDDPSVLRDLIAAGVERDAVRRLLVRPGSVQGAEAALPGIPAIADADAELLDPSDASFRALLAAIRARTTVSELPASAASPERVLRSEAEMRGLFRDVPEALAETRRVADACRFDLLALRAPPPRLEEESSGGGGREAAHARLEHEVFASFEGGRRLGRWSDPRYERRLRDELAVFEDLGYSAYVLAAAEIAGRARRWGVEVAARGSASSSLVVHVLGISDVDPLAHGLIFERFLRPDRGEPPDIDLDVPARRREQLLSWVFERFGTERVAQVIAHATFRRRSACRDGWLALGLDGDSVARICAGANDDAADAPVSSAALVPARHRGAAALVERLVGKPRHVSTHPGGIVISGEPLERHLPLERSPKGVVVTQFDQRSLQELRVVKLDVLGNLALGALERVEVLLGSSVEAPDRDPATLALLRSARTVGCFQVETPTIRSVLRRMPLRGIDDLAAALAIVRPGPASGEAKDEFLRRARGESAPDPPHPLLGAALATTHGMLLYEEDVIVSIATLTGWPLARADDAREALVAGTSEAAPRAFMEAASANGIPPAESEAAWGRIARLAAYSFNKAHAASYARIAWRSAFAKAHHRESFACAVLEEYGGAYPLRSVAAAFVREGVRLLAPDVERSGERHGIESGAVRIGLAAVAGLTARSRRAILLGRPFSDMADLLRRVRPSRRELEALVMCGACDALDPLTPDAYPFVHEELLRAAASGAPLERARGAPRPDLADPRAAPYRRLVRVEREIRHLRMHVSEHPLAILRPEAERAGCVPIRDLESRHGETLRVAGLVAAARRVPSRDGRTLQFVTLEDEHGTVEAVLWPDAYERLGDPVRAPGPFLATGRIEADHGDAQLVLEGLLPFHERRRARARGRELGAEGD